MKKKLFICVVTLFVLSECMLIASCTNDVVADGNAKVENKQDVNESKLISSLESLNKDLMTEKHIARKNKPKNPGWTTKQKLQVVVADFSGAWKGGKGGVSLGSKLGLIVGQPHTGAIVGGIIGAVVPLRGLQPLRVSREGQKPTFLYPKIHWHLNIPWHLQHLTRCLKTNLYVAIHVF